MSWSTSELRKRLAPRNWCKPFSKIFFTDPSKAVLLFLDHLCYLCLVFVMLSRLFIAALWSLEGKGLTFWLLFVIFVCVRFCYFPILYPGTCVVLDCIDSLSLLSFELIVYACRGSRTTVLFKDNDNKKKVRLFVTLHKISGSAPYKS